MLTRTEFEEAVKNMAEDGEVSQVVLAHDAAQRAEIERLMKDLDEAQSLGMHLCATCRDYPQLQADLNRLQAELIAWKHSAENADCLKDDIDRLTKALQALYDEQNGPPLCKYEAAWKAAMKEAEALLPSWKVRGDE